MSPARHRGRHPGDEVLFSPARVDDLRAATSDLSWLLERKYSPVAALKLVGDRLTLRERQRKAVLRAACAATAERDRRERRVGFAELSGCELAIDGFNVIVAVEAALCGGVVVIGRDGVCRDMSSVHGSYRRIEETERAAELVGEALAAAGPTAVRWYLDQPVSNSGRLKALLASVANARGWHWDVRVVASPDRALVEEARAVVATGDAWILDHCARWIDLAGQVIATLPAVWLVELR